MTATEKVITVDKVHLVTGGYASSAVSTMQEVCERYKIPFLFIGGSADELMQKGYKYSFRTTPKVTDWTTMTMNFVKEVIKPKTIGVVYELSLRGESQKNATLKFAKEYGWEVVTEGYTPGSLDFKPLLEKLKLADPDVLRFVAYSTDAVLMAKQMDEIGYKPKAVVVEGGLQNIDFLVLAGRYVKGWFIELNYWPDRSYPDFDEVYRKGLVFWQKYGKPLDNIAKDGYINLYILKDAIERCKSLEPEAVRDAVAKTNLFLPWYGHVRFTEEGNPLNGIWYLNIGQILPAKPDTPWQANGLSFYSVWPDYMKTTDPIYPTPK
jgi:branched-chain amino acid transport system substrate-binding protein